MGYRIGYNGPQVDDLLQKGYKYSVINNGWTKLESSDLAATNLDTLVTPGNYSTSFWQNGPIQLVTNGPINVCVTKDSSSNTLYQTIYDAGKIYIRSTTSTSFSNTWKEEQNNSSLDIGASTPVNPSDNYIWIDTSGDVPVIKIYKENRGEWVAISAADLAKKSVYDKNNVGKPFTTYLDEKIAEGDLATAENTYKKHIVEGEDTGNPIHVTSEEKLKWNAGISTSEADTLINNFKKDMQSYADGKVNTSSTKINDLTTEVNEQKKIMDSHMGDNTIHLTADQVTAFDNKAAGDHTHLNDGTVTVSTSNITGLIPVERLDPSVLERNYTVSSYDEMMALTKAEVQNGDSVFINTPTFTWTQGTMPSSQCWWDVCYGDGRFVAIMHSSNVFAYSTDGINWTQGTMPSSQVWESVCYANGKFVAVVYDSNIFAYSTDGITWTQGTMPSSQDWSSVCYGNGKFVVVANGSDVFAYSTDGINWTQGTMPSSQVWESVCYGNGKFVAVVGSGSNSSNIFAYSTDGINWTQGTMPSSQVWSSVCYGNGKFVAIVSDMFNYSANTFAYSTDGITWTQGTMPSRGDWEDICYGSSIFVAINTGDIAYSTDGINWTEMDLGSSKNWHSCYYGNDKFVVIGYMSDGLSYSSIKYSAQSAWFVVDDSKLGEYEPSNISSNISFKVQKYSSDIKYNWSWPFHQAYGNGIFIINYYADDNDYTKAYLYSVDGLNWNIGTISWFTDRVCCIKYINNHFLIVSSTKCAISTDGINWTEGSMPSSQDWSSVCYGNGKYVIISSNTSIMHTYYSTDGINWVASNDYEDIYTTQNVAAWQLSDIVYGNEMFIAVSGGSQTFKHYLYSTDGINWNTGKFSDSRYTYKQILYINSKFIAYAIDNIICYSSDGINWTEKQIDHTSRKIYYNHTKNTFIGVFDDRYIGYSFDGLNWKFSIKYDFPNSGNVYTIFYENDLLLFISPNLNGFPYYNGIEAYLTKLPTALVQYAAPTPELTWDNITNKPTTISDYGLSNTYYTADEINALYNQYMNQYYAIYKSVSDITDSLLEIPEDLSTTYDTNLARASELNKKLDDLLHSLGLNDKMISDMVNMYKERSIIYRSSLDTEIDFDSLTVGSTFFLGKYQVESEDPWDIEWEIVHQTDEYQIAMTKQVIDLRPFDAKEPTNTDSDRKNDGNNNWQYSNIKQFLNSDQASWYSAQHEYDAPPNSSNVLDNINSYDVHKGFLYYFSDEEKNLLKDMTLTLANPTVDGGGSYIWTGKVWLPTYTQMTGNQNNSISEGTKFDKYNSNSDRKKTINKYCAENNKYCINNSKTEGTSWMYWCSSVYPSGSYYTRGVDSGGGTGGGYGASGCGGGLAPCICLPRTGNLLIKTHDPSQKTVAIKYSYTNLSSDNLPTEVVNNKPTGESFTFDILTDSNKSYTHNIDDTHYPSGQVVDADDGSGYWTFSGWNTDDATIK